MKLKNKVATLINVNPRKEHHGEDLALACDVTLEAHCEKPDLAQFDKGLEDFLFGEHGPRFPELGSVAWGREYEKARVQIDDHKLKDVTIRKIELTPEPGDSLKVKFMATFYPATEVIGELADLMKSDVKVTVEQTQAELTDLMGGKSQVAEGQAA